MTSPPINILLVDDRPENLLVLEELLDRPDRRILKAQSGNEALKLMLKQELAVVLLDVEMPEMDGYETAQLMRSTERTRRLPIIFVTAGDRTEARTFRGYEVGAVDFLYKPIDTTILKSKVDVFVELHRKTAELEAVNRLLERTSATLRDKLADLQNVNQTVSHDLRAPLRSIHGFAEILAESLHGKLEPQNDDYLQRIVRASARMGRMLDGLFALLRLGSASDALHEIDAEAVLRDVREDLRGDIERSGAVITHDPLPRVHASSMMLPQILQNLIVNAIKFARPGQPRIHLSAELVDDAWRFGVCDNGVGIAPDSLERVFGLFERLGGESSPGSGVGLTLCKRAVEKHGGKIWVESTPGEGSTFYFTIPRQPASSSG